MSFISRNGATYWQAAQRSFDPWGVMRNGAAGFWQPFNRYCGNLGHKNDDESSMTYMRARYYDQGCGRFISADRGYQGANLFAYCGNNPVGRDDANGMNWLECQDALLADFVKACEANPDNSAAAIAAFIKDAMATITHYYNVEPGRAMQCEALARASEFEMEMLPIIEQLGGEAMHDDFASRGAQHRLEATLIKVFGVAEIGMYIAIIQMDDPLSGLGYP